MDRLGTNNNSKSNLQWRRYVRRTYKEGFRIIRWVRTHESFITKGQLPLSSVTKLRARHGGCSLKFRGTSTETILQTALYSTTSTQIGTLD